MRLLTVLTICLLFGGCVVPAENLISNTAQSLNIPESKVTILSRRTPYPGADTWVADVHGREYNCHADSKASRFQHNKTASSIAKRRRSYRATGPIMLGSGFSFAITGLILAPWESIGSENSGNNRWRTGIFLGTGVVALTIGAITLAQDVREPRKTYCSETSSSRIQHQGEQLDRIVLKRILIETGCPRSKVRCTNRSNWVNKTQRVYRFQACGQTYVCEASIGDTTCRESLTNRE